MAEFDITLIYWSAIVSIIMSILYH